MAIRGSGWTDRVTVCCFLECWLWTVIESFVVFYHNVCDCMCFSDELDDPYTYRTCLCVCVIWRSIKWVKPPKASNLLYFCQLTVPMHILCCSVCFGLFVFWCFIILSVVQSLCSSFRFLSVPLSDWASWSWCFLDSCTFIFMKTCNIPSKQL